MRWPTETSSISGSRFESVGVEPVDLGGQDEVVLGQTVRDMGRERYGHMPPSDCEIRMVSLTLGEERDLGRERERVAEVVEIEGAADRVRISSPIVT